LTRFFSQSDGRGLGSQNLQSIVAIM
jgi:hypothetical protein